MVLETYSKVNLTLELLRRRADGYHDLATVFCATSLGDRIAIAEATELSITCDHPDVPDGPDNLVWKAVARLAEIAGIVPRVRIHIAKTVPPGGGLGGGSANAAGVLAALARRWRTDLEAWEMRSLAAGLGSDVAFFLEGGAALGTRRGEQLEPLPPPSGTRIVVLAPREPVSTGAVYGAVRGFRGDAGAASARVAAALRAGEVPDPAWLANDLEGPACRVHPSLAEDRAALDGLGLGDARLCGSGGSWYVLTSLHDGGAVRQRLLDAFAGRAVYLADPVNRGWRVVSED